MNSSETRLTTDGALKQDPVFVGPDEVVYTVLESAVRMRLVRFKPGAATAALHADATASEFEPTFAADGGAYAFVQSRGNLNLKLVVRDAAAGRDAVVDAGGGFAGLRHPSFHPKGERVCFGIPAATGQVIASVGRDAKDRRTLATGGVNAWPAYSPDGTRIAFCSSRDGTLALYVMAADGGDVRRVGRLDGMQLRPCWSPDGARLAFTWNRGGTYHICAVNPDGTGLVQLTASGERSDYAAWHPDGASVVFVGERDGAFDLYRLPAK
jgi:TolB protein